VLFSIVSTPPNCLWQQFLEETFPGTKQVAVSKEKDEGKAPKKQSLNVGNTLIKFVLDQSLGAAFNTYIFIVFMKGVNGGDLSQILDACKQVCPKFSHFVESISCEAAIFQWEGQMSLTKVQDAFPLWIAGLKVWPLVSLLNFTIMPVESRVLFASAVGVLWGIYLSLLAAKV
jgi:protein Mpv17